MSLIDLKAAKLRQRHYETIFILSPAISDADAKAIFDRAIKTLEETKGTILRQDPWGKKRMAYLINKHAMGNYFYLRYIGGGDTVRALERILKLEAAVLRFQTVRLSAPLSSDEIKALVEKAPREQSAAPQRRFDDEEMPVEAPVHN